MKIAWTYSALLATMLMANIGAAGEPIIRSYESPSGDTYGAVSVKLADAAGIRSNVDHVILVDTSASQVGEYRKVSFEALKGFLLALPEGHRAMVVAVDVAAVKMTDEFAAPGQTYELAEAKLKDRFPAGSTNIAAGIQFALTALEESQHGAISFIGDGMSAASLLKLDDAQDLTLKLKNHKIPVHSFAVGSNMDLQLLGVLAQETGGFVIRDEVSEQSLTGEEAGRVLATAAIQTVVYPETVALSKDDVSLLPNRPLPLRADRETVYLFHGKISSETVLSLGTHEWKLPVAKRTTGNTFLQNMWQFSADSDGLVLGLAADWMVNLAHQQFENNVLSLEAQGVRALNTGAFETAERIGFSLQDVDPGNTTAMQLINRAGQEMALQTVQLEGENSAVDQAVEAAADVDDRTEPRAESAIEEYKQLQEARTQALRAEVDRGVERALSVVDVDPDAALSVLNQVRGAVKSATDIEPEVRNQLLRRLTATQQDLISQKQKIALNIAERNKRLVEIEAQRRLIDYATERDQKLEQLVDRIRALLLEGYQGDAGAFESAESVAREVLSEYPNSAMGVSVVFVSEAAGQLDKAQRLRSLRSDRFLESLYQVELSHVPFPDEPPVRYPPAEVWQALTIMRKKWEAVDLRSDSPNEAKIYDALDEITNIEFPGNPLTDVVDYISSQHGIPIILDEAELSNDGISGDDEVELVLSGITLRSALKLLLEPLGLTYVIEDEVMKITTELAAADSLQTRVYPVADLVIPIFPLGGGFGGGLGGGGGQQGGLGGQQGGFGGGGQGGFGGGGQGGFGGGGGQGLFSVPAQPVPNKKKLNLK